ncbi:MAG: septal ring lytic transglycosylase RlpA family protein [Chlorobiaceae bacterium]|jgi:rare lipoprotein A|nr:septal ring lytic transglycosylase RlpA family protein [Chlorobiaceae bacterium]NTW64335.1 septal ring lytic transglycosylase RlpA family protein [Chlorobiaceae bacterium]
MRRFFFVALTVLFIGLASCKTYQPPNKRVDTSGLSPSEAFRLGKIKNTPYVINGKLYMPMSYEQATAYEETGIASWYGQETLEQHNGQATAYGETFYPDKPSAAHKYLPLPSIVRVTNLDTKASIEVRVNDRGPFVDNRVIDLSAEAAKQLGFYEKGTARVKLEVISKP